MKTKNQMLTVSAVLGLLMGTLGITAAKELDTAVIPIIVNVASVVSIMPPADAVGARPSSMRVHADTPTMLYLITDAGGFVTISHRRTLRNTNDYASMRHLRGVVSLTLNSQIFGDASITLTSVSGRRVLSDRVNATNGTETKKIFRSNVAAGVYLLSIKGRDGNTFVSRFTHIGGRLNVNVVFGVTSSKKNAVVASENSGVWRIVVNSIYSEMLHTDTTVRIRPLSGINDSLNIILHERWVFGSQFNPEIEYGVLVDKRDNQSYRTVQIGSYTWMAENLKYKGYYEEFKGCYDRDTIVCAVYGNLYFWIDVMGFDWSCNSYSCANRITTNHQGICPEGWRIPNESDWDDLVYTAGGWEIAGSILKSHIGWYSYDGISSTDEFGFSALPGNAIFNSNFLTSIGFSGVWWSTHELAAEVARSYSMSYSDNRVRSNEENKFSTFPVRCVR